MQRALALIAASLVLVVVASAGCKRARSSPGTFAEGKERVSVLFAGDTSFARGLTEMIEVDGRGDAAYAFDHVKHLFQAADLSFLNLECVMSDSGESEAKKTWRIRAATKYASGLRDLGVDVVSVANNHALDFGQQGFSSTLRTLDAQGVLYTGAQVKEPEEQDPLVVTVGKTKIGFLGYNAHGDEHSDIVYRPRSMGYKIARVIEDVIRARPQVDALVVSVHWGPELSHIPWDWQKRDAHKLIDAGVDLVIGHHPHVQQPVELYKEGIIVYSLGDLLFDKSSPWLVHRTAQRIALRVEFEGPKRVSWELVPMLPEGVPPDLAEGAKAVSRYRPRPAPELDTETWVWGPEPPREWRLSEHVKDLVVQRELGGKVEPCDEWEKRRPLLPSGFLRWLAPRWRCPDEKKRPWLTVAKTGEIAEGRLQGGVWAAPHLEGPLIIRAPAVRLGDELQAVAGIPDWWVDHAPNKNPVRFEVKVPGTDLSSTTMIPVEKGWREFRVDTASLAGATHELIVEISGGPADLKRDTAFLFDLAIPQTR
jgi:hypothetical protein